MNVGTLVSGGNLRVAGRLLLVALAMWPASASAQSPWRFTEITPGCGLEFRMTCGAEPSRYILEVDGGGVALLDYDNDGDLDIFLANGAALESPEQGPGSRLYANRGDATFEDVTARVGLSVTRWAMGAAVGDADGDGWDDLYVTCYGPDILLKNDCKPGGSGRFVDVTEVAGVADPRWGTSAAFGDTDGDGDLDLYVANYLIFDVKNPPDRTGKLFKGVEVMAGPAGLPSEHDAFYENLGDGRFRDVTTASGIVEKTQGYGLGVRMFDFDADGRLDIFVGNDSTENFLFRNLGGGHFQDVAVVSGIAANAEGSTQATMGIALGDVDGNGFVDVFTTNFSSDTDTLHLNLGDGFFDDRTSQYGLGLVSRPFLSWGAGFYDFDLDGDEDLFIASGHVYPEARTHNIDSEYEQPVRLHERRGPRFERRTDLGDMFAKKYSGRATAFGDLDGDGDVDIVMTTLNGPVHIFRNDIAATGRLAVALRGRGGDRHAYGASVELASGGTVLGRRWIGGGSYQSGDAPCAYFGIPADRGDLELRVRWLDGQRSVHAGVQPGHAVLIRAGQPTVEARPLRPPSK